MFVDAGKLDKHIQIIAREYQSGPGGYEIPIETVVRSAYAMFTQVSGTEIVRANADFGRVNVRFLVRASHIPIDRKMLVRYDGEDYEIQYINNYGDAGKYTEIWCVKEGLGG